MAGPEVFAPRSPSDARHLVSAFPLCWITSGAGAEFQATLLPLRPVAGDDGSVVELIGHFARSNAQVAALRDDPRAVVLALGPQGYISPSWMEDRAQAPTWNYASAQFTVDIEFFENGAEIAAHLQDLVGHMEQGRDKAWTVPEMGARYAELAKRIIGFRARVTATRAKFKLGQDERPDVYADIMEGLGAGQLVDWMQAFNPER
ncbi:FMN-binding negative transcriptional regulator [Govanella unica]|uniref:FMN-binding negative transcriptional regulator n=1 Tax=Govanella unica TaxID=2975056 RepID=A0A9X3TYZ5_9PROT|nr:FMN-binding negative transcriptional regulator [Govania unica]MDA5193987.1 FMN-binding negative transcriptional regulator [Govania unica]